MMERDAVPVKVRRYRWPELLLSVMLFILFVCGAIVCGSFAYFTDIQKRLFIEIPWLAPSSFSLGSNSIRLTPWE
jgi:predicted ribosomally synthesized peptide with SipW-like signal peptide